MSLSDHIKNERFDEAIALVKNNYPLSCEDGYKSSPLRYAIKSGNVEMVKLLLERGASVDPSDRGNKCLVFTALTHNDTEEISVLLVSYGANIKEDEFNNDDDDKGAILEEACRNEFTNLVSLLLDEYGVVGYPVNPLIIYEVITSEHVDIAKLLIKHGYSLNVDITPVRNIEMLRLLVNTYGSKIINDYNILTNNIKYNHLNAPLIIEIIKLGADLTKLDWSTGGTPLHYAVRYGNIEIVNTMLQYGANPFAKNIIGITPIDVARSLPQSKKIYQLLQEWEPPHDIKEPEFN
jgi:ankyrin repeat protein